MTEIKVILDEGPAGDLSLLNAEERGLLFDQLAHDNPDIPRVIIDSFAEMQNDLIQKDARLLKPDLKELLLRKTIQLGQNRGSNFNTAVIPVIPGFATVTIKRPHPGPKTARGGAMPPMRRMRPQEPKAREETPGAVRVRFDQQIFAVTKNGLDYIVPPNEELEVLGIVVNPICEAPHMISPRGGLRPVTAVTVSKPTVGERLVLGNYNFSMASSACDNYFIHPDYSITIAGETFKEPTKIMFTDMDESKVTASLSAVFDYLSSFEAHDTSLQSAQFVHTQIDIANRGDHAVIAVQPQLRSVLEDVRTPREIAPVRTESAGVPDIVPILEGLHNGRFSTVYLTALLADIDMRGFSRTYYKAAIKGKDDPSVKEQLDVYKARQARMAFQNSVRAKLLDERNKLNTYKIIIEKKLGADRMREVEMEISRRPSVAATAKNVLELLRPAERKPVELEFERRSKYLEAVVNNKCPHVKLYRQYRLAKTDERTRQYFGELRKFFKNPSEERSMIVCNNCGFDVMCPHVRDYTEMDLAGKFHGEIKGRLTKYIDKSVTRDSYYCKICGEMISSLEAFGDVGAARDPASAMNEELKNFMWGEMAILAKYLKFGSLVNVPQLITAMRDACYPYIFEIEKQILKSKTNSADEIKAKKRLFITVYAFAYMIHLILSNKGRGDTEISFKNFAPKNPKNSIVELIKYALETIVMSRNIIIREIPGMTADLIKNKLIEAYKSLQSTGTQVITHSGEAEDLLTTLLLDPVYHYLYMVNSIDDILSGKKPGKGRFDIVDKVDHIMGAPLAKLEKSEDVFKHAKRPKFDARWNPKYFDEIKPMKNAQTSADGRPVFRSAHPGYVARSFEVFDDKLKSRLYIEPMYVDVSASGKGDPNAPMDVKFRDPFEKHRARYLDLEARETQLLKYRAMESAKNWTYISGKGSRRWADPNAHLGRIYDEDGAAHAWNLYVVEKTADGVKQDLKASDIAKSTESGTRFTDRVADKKCSVCGTLWSQAGSLDESKIRDALNARHAINNFFRFYENRCPKGGLHDFGNGTRCGKCGIDNTHILNSTTKDAMNYYREFRPTYARERDEFATGDDSSAWALQPAPATTDYGADYGNWTFNFNVLLDLANKLKINHRLLSALGAVEKQEYAEVQSGAYIPPEAEERNDTRIYVVNTHVKNLITEYNQVRYFHRLVKPPVDLSVIIDNSGINKHKIAELGKKLPDIFDDYNNRFTYVHRNKKPREIVSFCIQSFCEMCLKIWSDGEKETEKLRHDFVNYFVKKVLRAEELLSKPGHFNWSLLYGDKEVKEKESYDMNTSKDLEGETDREFEETEETEEDFGDTSKPFDTGFDVEKDPDSDPTDEDDNDVNDWKVGEDMGLS